jgi:hypothetical protein
MGEISSRVRRLHPHVASALLAVLLCALAGCSRSTRDWEIATKEDSAAAYERFVAAHADDPRAASARERIEQIAFAAADTAAGPERAHALARFAERYPDSELARRARSEIDRLAYAAASASGALVDLESYLTTHADGAHATEARTRIAARLADRPEPFRGLRRVRLVVQKDFTWENWNPEEEDEPTPEPFEPNVDFEDAARVWLENAGLLVVAAGEAGDGELRIEAEGTPISELYNFPQLDFPVGRYEGAELSGRIRFAAGGAAPVERRFAGEVVPPEQVSVTVHAAAALPFNDASDAPFDRAALLPGSFQERLAELVCASLGPSVLTGGTPEAVQTWNGVAEARMRKLLDDCRRRARRP